MHSQKKTTVYSMELREIPSRTSTAQHSDPHRDIQDMILKKNEIKEISSYIERTDEKNRDKIKVLVLAYCCAHAKHSLAKTLIVNGVLTLQDFLKAKFTIKDVAPVLDILLTEKQMLPIYNFLSKEKLEHRLRQIPGERFWIVEEYNQHKISYPADELRINICQYLAMKYNFKEDLYNYLNKTTEIEQKEFINTLKATFCHNPSPLNLLGNVLYHPRPVSTAKSAAFYSTSTILGIALFIPTGGISLLFTINAFISWEEGPSLIKGTLKKFLCLYGRLTYPDNKCFQENWMTAAMTAPAFPEFEDQIKHLATKLGCADVEPTAISTALLTAQPKSAVPLHSSPSITVVSSTVFSSASSASNSTATPSATPERRLSQS